MIFGIIMMVMTIVLTIYIFFSAAKFQNDYLASHSYEVYQKQAKFTRYLSNLTLLASIAWWVSYIMVKFVKKEFPAIDRSWFVDTTFLIVLSIIMILLMLNYRNKTYRKYLIDNTVKVFIYEYVMIFIFGILYASIITYAYQITNVIF